MEQLLLNKPGQKLVLLGNEAIVRGALEAGVNFVATYPGTPASEIGNLFFRLSRSGSYAGYFEFSTNEKTALEAGIGASLAGQRVLVAMKNFGLNVCLDALLPFAYTGTNGPTVIVIADDPGCHSSAQSEENTRFVSLVSHLPILEPADPAEAKEFIKFAFRLSLKYQIPVIVRTTTRVAHQRGIVRLDKLPPIKVVEPRLIKNQKKFVTLPPRVLEMKKELLSKIEKIRDLVERSEINFIERNQKIKNNEIALITAGITYLYAKEALLKLNLTWPILKLGFFHPLPEEKIKRFIQPPLKKILIIEELEPYLEKEVERLAKQVNPSLIVYGKKFFSAVGEIQPARVYQVIAGLANKKIKEKSIKIKLPVIKHLPRFCPGCPYWSVFSTIKKVAPKETIFGGDIGCYMLAGLPPHQMQDYLSCMGSSVGIAHGLTKVLSRQKKKPIPKTICFIGDSTFFHAGIPALINTVFNKSNPIIIILDNGTTAMTGHQPNPGTAWRRDLDYQFAWTGQSLKTENSEKPLEIESIVKACGIKKVKVVNSFNAMELEQAVREFLREPEVSVIIARGLCALLAKSLKK